MLLSSGHFVNDVGQNILPTLTPILMVMFSLNNAAIGFLIGVQHIAGSILQTFFGYIDDKYSLRLTAPIGMLITTLSISLIGIITNYNILLVIALMTGIGKALFHPAATSHVSHIAKKRRNTVISIFIQIGSIGFEILAKKLEPNWRASPIKDLKSLFITCIQDFVQFLEEQHSMNLSWVTDLMN